MRAWRQVLFCDDLLFAISLSLVLSSLDRLCNHLVHFPFFVSLSLSIVVILFYYLLFILLFLDSSLLLTLLLLYI